MRQYALRRLLLVPILVLGITLLDFIFINLAPGDPISAMMNPTEMANMSPEAMEARREALGLDRPMLVRYGLWLKELAQGNLGYSLVKSQPVSELMARGLRNTVPLLLLSLFITTIVGIVLGAVSALRPNSITDYLLTAFAFAGVGMPSFFFALVLIRVGALQFGWFPTSGLSTPGVDATIGDRLNHLALPLIALSINGVGGLMRFMRASLIEVLHEEFVMTARAKGLAEYLVVVRHAMRNALLPVITILGLRIPGLFGGAVIIEAIFNIPGIGLLMIEGMKTKDYPVIMGGILMSGFLVLISSLIADLCYAVADPRIRYGD